MAKTTTFRNHEAASSGPYSGNYVWSDPSNWTNGVPVNGDTVIDQVGGLDDIASLSLVGLTDTSTPFFVRGGLTVGTLTIGAGASISVDTTDVQGSGVPGPSFSVSTILGTGGSLLAVNVGSLFVSNSDPGENYFAENGGTIELNGAVASTSTLGVLFGGVIALSAPGPTTAAQLFVGASETLELPGTALIAALAGAASLSVTTDKGTFAFTNVGYLSPLMGISASVDRQTGLLALVFDATDTFSRTTAAGGGALAGQFLWSTAANWSLGVPNPADAVAMPVSGTDNLANLSLATLGLTNSATLLASGGQLTIGTLALDGIGGIDVSPASGSGQVLIETLTSATAAGRLAADTANASLFVEGTLDPGASYVASGGGTLGLEAPLAAASSLTYGGAGRIILFNPGATTAASVQGLAPGDTLDLPGGTLDSVAFGAHGLTVTTSAGTFAFTNVAYAAPVRGYTASRDTYGNTAIAFTATDTFQQVSGLQGAYDWSNAANWTSGVPAMGAAASTGVTGFDDIANLSLSSLALSPGGDVFVTNGLLHVGTLTAGANTELLAEGIRTGAFVVADSIAGAGAIYGATGTQAAFADLATSDPGETYEAQFGGTVKLAASPVAASTLQFNGVGTFELFAPAPTVAAALTGIVAGDRLELPGTAVLGVTLGVSSLSVTTDLGTTNFGNLAFASVVTGVTSGHDAASGLASLTFTDQAHAADFNGDGTSDQLWQAASGALIDYTMKNGNITGAAIVGALDGSYKFLAAGDFHGDGTADQLWQAANGAIIDYAMKNGTITGSAIVGSLDASFRFLAAADFNGDGTTDQLWQASSGAIIDFAMQNGAITVATGVGSLDSTWTFLAAADFNGDGTADQLWKAANGTVVDYAMNNGTISAANVVGSFDSSMKFLAAADFNGDGRADMLWQDKGTGAIVDYTMNGAAITATTTVGALDATWRFLAAGDFNGDGTADQLWQAAGGALVDFTMKSGVITSGAQVGALDSSYRFLA